MKTVLIITYYWPPAGGPGVQRWLKFVKYLPQFGIQPIVYCPENPSYPIVDDSLLSEVHDDVLVIKKPIKEPYGLAALLLKKDSKTISSGIIPKTKKQTFLQKLMLFVRGNFFIPDARVGWVKPSVDFLKDYIQKAGIQTIITTGPPHSLHLIGFQLKKNQNLKWIADFRDPWTTIGYHKQLKLTKSAAEKHRSLETEILNSADHLIVTSENTKKEFQQKTTQPITVITNGYDVSEVSVPEKDEKFTLSHIGSLLSERNPKILWQVLKELIADNESFREEFQLNLIGVVSAEILEELKSHHLENHLNYLGYVDHDQAIQAQMKSQLLLLVEIDSEETKAIIPAKLFEYMVSQTPIIAIGPRDSDVEHIVNATKTGRYFSYKSAEPLKSHILECYNYYKSGTLKTSPIGLEAYSREALTEKLVGIF